jgi:HEAT repeat protein
MGKTSKSNVIRIKHFARSLVTRVKARPVVSSIVMVAMAALVVGAVFRNELKSVISTPPTVAEMRKDVSTSSSPSSWRELGHAEAAAGRPTAALKAYDKAVSLDRTIVDEKLLTNIGTYYYNPKLQPVAADLIIRHKLVDAAGRLERMTDHPEYAVRWAALDTLEKLGKASKFTYRRALVSDLEEAKCDVRRNAIDKLGALGDPHAISSLRQAKKKDRETTPWYKATCLGSRPDKAEKLILAKSKA